MPSQSPAGDARNEAVLRVLIEAVESMIAIAHPDGTLWLWNGVCETAAGVPLSEVAGEPLWDVLRLRPNLRSEAQESLRRLLAGDVQVVPFQSVWARSDGRKVRIAWNARLASWGGEALLIVATGSEVMRGRRVARALVETEARYEALLDLLPDPVIVYQDGKVVFADAAAERMYGAEPSQLLGLPVLERVAPESLPLVLRRLEMSRGRVEKLLPAEERHLRLDGSVVDVEVTSVNVLFGGRPAVELVARDISDRKATEAALRSSEAQMRSLLEAAPAVVWSASVEGVLTSVYGRADQIYHGSVGSLVGRNIFDVASRIPEFLAAAQTALAGEPTIVRIRRPNLALECRLNPMIGPDGAVTGLTGVVIDTRESEAAAVERAETEARVRAVFDETSLGMVLLDSEGHCLESNAAFQALLGYTQDELHRLTVAEYTHPADVAETTRALRDVFSGTMGRHEMEKRYIAKDGREVWVRVHISPVKTAAGPPSLTVGTVEDISEHKNLEEQLAQTSKMEALGRLAGGVAHDFNNLLTVVNGYADLLAMSLEGDERAADAREIRQAGARATELTAQLLAFGRRSPRALEAVDLNERVGAMVPMLRRLLGEDIEFVVDLDPNLGAVEADPSQFDQVVMNLVVNGRDAMPSGGELKITTCRIESSTGGIEPRDLKRHWARLEISDSGFGMAPDILEHIFEPFFTTKGKGKGTGLGLAMVYGIVRQMSGHIRVESAIGVGSKFIVELPLGDSAASADPAGAVATGTGGRGETILLVEDEPAVREFCRRALEGDGYRVYATGPREALEAASTLGTGPDLLVTDVVMPDFDGPTIAAALSARKRGLRVLFMSGYPRDREGELTGAAAGGTILGKPFTPRDLCDAVRRVLDRPERVG